MATTTNFGWETPDDTDLVKDGAAAIRTALGGVDTSFVDLKGGTTGQVLAKASNTDLDFVWSADASGIPATIVDAKGDLIAATAADTVSRLAVGTNGQVLTADSTAATGIKWATAASGGMTLIASGSAAGSATTVSITSIPATYKDLYLIVRNFRTSVDGRAVAIRFNGDSATRYVYSNSDFQINGTFNASSIVFGSAFDDTVTTGLTSLTIPDYTNTTTWKMLQGLTMGADNGTPTNCKAAISFGAYNQTGAISQVDITSTSGNITCNYLLYGVN